MKKLLSIIVIIVVIIIIVALAGKNRGESPVIEETAMEEMEGATTFVLALTNLSTTQPLSPGVFIVHTEDATLDFEGQAAPDALEPLAEYGDNTDFAEFVSEMDGVAAVITIDEPLAPGESTTIEIEAEPGMLLSGVMMAVASNDGYALIDSVTIDSGVVAQASNYDAGTEANSELGSGFNGGQPEEQFGDDNIDNGTETSDPVNPHDQLTDPILRIGLAVK